MTDLKREGYERDLDRYQTGTSFPSALVGAPLTNERFGESSHRSSASPTTSQLVNKINYNRGPEGVRGLGVAGEPVEEGGEKN